MVIMTIRYTENYCILYWPPICMNWRWHMGCIKIIHCVPNHLDAFRKSRGENGFTGFNINSFLMMSFRIGYPAQDQPSTEPFHASASAESLSHIVAMNINPGRAWKARFLPEEAIIASGNGAWMRGFCSRKGKGLVITNPVQPVKQRCPEIGWRARWAQMF